MSMRKCWKHLLYTTIFVGAAMLFFYLVSSFIVRPGAPDVMRAPSVVLLVIFCCAGLYHLAITCRWTWREVQFRKAFGFSAPQPGDWAKSQASHGAVANVLRVLAKAMDAAFQAENDYAAYANGGSFNEKSFEEKRKASVFAKRKFWKARDLAEYFGYPNKSNEYKDYL